MDQCSNRCGPDAVCPRWANAVALICQRWPNAATVVGPMLFANVGPSLHIGANLHWANVGLTMNVCWEGKKRNKPHRGQKWVGWDERVS